MGLQSKLITMPEYGELSFKELENLTGKNAVGLIKKINIENKTEIFKLFYDRLKATQYVGFAKIGALTLQVIPKTFGDDSSSNLHFLLQLLKYTHKLKLSYHELGSLGKLKDDFFEVLIYLFSKHLRDLLRQDFRKNYVTYEKSLPFLKGKLLIKEQIKFNSVNNTKYFSRYEEFTEDNLMNQIFKFTTSLLIKISKSSTNKKLLEDISIYLCDVSYRDIVVTDFNKIHITRLNANYEPILNICRLILENTSIHFSLSKIETFVFMFDMNKLFEEFVFRFIKKHKSAIFINNTDKISYVKDQVFLGKLFGEFNMRGDLLIRTAKSRNVLLDTKYKLLSDDMLHGGVSQSDIYQMFAYAVSQEEKYNDIILLYPFNKSADSRVSRPSLTHFIEPYGKVTIHIKTIHLTKIYDVLEKKINEKAMIDELNNALKLEARE